MKLDIYITDPVDFCKGGENQRNAFTALFQIDGRRSAPDSWVYVQTIEIDETLIDTDAVLVKAIDLLDDKEHQVKAEYAARMADLERHRGEMLAIEVKP